MIPAANNLKTSAAALAFFLASAAWVSPEFEQDLSAALADTREAVNACSPTGGASGAAPAEVALTAKAG